MPLAAHSKLGPYEILAQIGAGGMGEVYRAQDTRLHRTVAVKVLPHDKLADDDRKRRFLQEARAASALNHPYIVVLHDISSDAGVDFIVMEYVPGMTLKERIRSGALPFADVARYGAQIASALAAAYAAGIVHRDIKPANIMVTPAGQIKVLDFGLAKLSQVLSDSEADTLTMLETTPGVIAGTVAYMSPEQTRAESLDGRTDIFSLGSVLYEAATGRLPFQGPSTLAVMHAIAAEEAHAPSAVSRNLPPEFDVVIERALAKGKNDRFGSAKEMMEALQALSPRPEIAAVAHVSGGKKWWLAAVALSALLGGALYLWQSRLPKHHVPLPEAYELYEKGRRHIQEFTEQSFNQSIVDFQNAVKIDPDYAAAWAGLADAYAYQASSELKAPGEAMPAAGKYATMALEKDPATAEAYTSLALVALAYDWEWPLAEQRLRKSLALNPHDAFTQHLLGHYYEFMGRWEDAQKQMQLALDMDKLSPMYGDDVVYDLFINRRFEEAARRIGPIVERNPKDVLALQLQALVLEALGKRENSLAAADLAKLPGMFGGAASVSGVYCRQGRVADARQILKEMQDAQKQGHFVASFEFAGVYFALGEKDKGMRSLGDSVKAHDFALGFGISDPVFDSVRTNPEFAALMNQMHLPPGDWRDPPRFGK